MGCGHCRPNLNWCFCMILVTLFIPWSNSYNLTSHICGHLRRYWSRKIFFVFIGRNFRSQVVSRGCPGWQTDLERTTFCRWLFISFCCPEQQGERQTVNGMRGNSRPCCGRCRCQAAPRLLCSPVPVLQGHHWWRQSRILSAAATTHSHRTILTNMGLAWGRWMGNYKFFRGCRTQ